MKGKKPPNWVNLLNDDDTGKKEDACKAQIGLSNWLECVYSLIFQRFKQHNHDIKMAALLLLPTEAAEEKGRFVENKAVPCAIEDHKLFCICTHHNQHKHWRGDWKISIGKGFLGHWQQPLNWQGFCHVVSSQFKFPVSHMLVKWGTVPI